MARCEDYPCCGHEPGDCPEIDSKGRARYRCVECGKRLRPNATSSICGSCQRMMNDPYYDIDHDHSMDY